MSELRLKQEIFSQVVIQQAIADYQGLAQIQMTITDTDYCLSFQNCLYPIERTMKEFENYVIGLTFQKK
jgi:hypothetical protein